MICQLPISYYFVSERTYFKSSLFLISPLKFPKLSKCFNKNFYKYFLLFCNDFVSILYKAIVRIQIPNTREYVNLAKKGIGTLCKFAFLKSRRDVSLDKDPETYYFRFPFMI